MSRFSFVVLPFCVSVTILWTLSWLLRNKMGDAHVRTYKPERHHAKLAVNSAKTLTDFLIDTLEYQERTGRIISTG